MSLVDFGDFRKATPGIMESWRARAPIDPAHCFIAVGSPSPGRAVATKGTGVHWLKGDVSWVQYVVRQYGLYLLGVLLPDPKNRQVRKERLLVAAGWPVVVRHRWAATL